MRRRLLLLVLLASCCRGVAYADEEAPVDAVCWSEDAPALATEMGVASVTIEYCGASDLDPHVLTITSFNSMGGKIPSKSYHARYKAATGTVDETIGSEFEFPTAAMLGPWFAEYDQGVWGSSEPCEGSGVPQHCVELGNDVCGGLGGGPLKTPWSITYVKGSKILTCRFHCHNVSGWYYANCTLPSPAPAQPAPTCPCAGQPECGCGG